MLTLIVVSSILALAVGLALKFGFDYLKEDYSITWIEYAICAVVIVFAVAPLVSKIGWDMSVNSQTTFHEDWNGFELQVTKDVHQCYESSDQGGSTGGCSRTFDADSYTVQVPYQVCTTVSDGNNKSHTECHTEWRTETRWRQVPYTQEETTYVIHTTLGDYTVGDNWLQDNPNAHRIRARDGSMDAIPSGTPSGIPPLWSAAQERINRGDPGPVVQRHDYANYILPSQDTILHQYSSAIERYKQEKVLPDLSHDPIYNYYNANHAFLMGVNPPGDWNFAVSQFNAALGTDLQGDLYLVVVDANKVSDGQDYIMALTAYWEAEKYFGKDAVSKNAIIVAVGTKDGKTVDWARATTGMPVGNVAMLDQIENDLPGTALTPDALLGHPKAAKLYKDGSFYKVDIAHSDGALEKIVWGPNKFDRVCMTCSGEKGKVGYDYLKKELHPEGWGTFWIYFFTVLGSLLVWGAALFIGVPAGRSGIGAARDYFRDRWSGYR